MRVLIALITTTILSMVAPACCIDAESLNFSTQRYHLNKMPNSEITKGTVTNLNTRDFDSTRLHPDKVAEILDSFFQKMASYVNGVDFNYLQFGIDIEKLRLNLSDIEFEVEIAYYYERFQHQIDFVRKVFQSMVDATENLKRYSGCQLPGHDLVHKLIELNVRALVLHDSHGDLDFRIKDFERKVLSLSRTFFFLEEDMNHLTEVLVGMRSIFYRQMAKVREILESLVSQFPSGFKLKTH